VPLSQQAVGAMTIDHTLQKYNDELLANARRRLDAVRKTTVARDMMERIRAADGFRAVESPWSCSRVQSAERDHTANKTESNKDTTVGTERDIKTLRHYRSKLSDIWVAAFRNELEEVNLYMECGADASARNSMVRRSGWPHMQPAGFVYCALVAAFRLQRFLSHSPLIVACHTVCVRGPSKPGWQRRDTAAQRSAWWSLGDDRVVGAARQGGRERNG
jgi:hypothetical protein